MITRLKLSTIEQGLPKYRSMLAGNDAYIPTSFESIATITPSAGATTAIFTSIPSTYKHLQIRGYVARSGGNGELAMQFNGDTGTNYADHALYGSNGIVATFANSSQAYINNLCPAYVSTNAWKGVTIIDIHDYSSTTKNKTVRCFNGIDNNTTTDGIVRLVSGLWMNTAAINEIKLYMRGDIFATTTFALYGIKG